MSGATRLMGRLLTKFDLTPNSSSSAKHINHVFDRLCWTTFGKYQLKPCPPPSHYIFLWEIRWREHIYTNVEQYTNEQKKTSCVRCDPASSFSSPKKVTLQTSFLFTFRYVKLTKESRQKKGLKFGKISEQKLTIVSGVAPPPPSPLPRKWTQAQLSVEPLAAPAR